MKIERITYQKTFPLAPYVNEKIGVEIELSEGDKAEDTLDLAKTIVEGWHKENNPHLYQQESKEPWVSSPTISAPQTIEFRHVESIPIISKDTERLKDTIEDMILECKSMEELAALKPSATANGLIPQYMKKVKELSNGNSIDK